MPPKHPRSPRKKTPRSGKPSKASSTAPRPSAAPGRFSPTSKPSDEGPNRVVGVLARGRKGWILQSTNRRDRSDYILHAKTRFDLIEGHLAVAEVKNHRRFGPREAVLTEILGDINSPKAVSLIAIATHDIPHHFPKDVEDEANACQPVTLNGRVDLRAIPLITIDGEDARDFDDAVFAEPHGDQGWHLIVAIADVAHYVRPQSPLDREAYTRGNSTYFPDRVVPMLPEALSNELCSLKPNVDRATLAVHIWLNKEGEMTRWQFVRGVMRSHARLTYTEAQRAIDGHPNTTTAPLIDPVLKPLYGAYRCLLAARGKRGTLELDLPERKVTIDGRGRVNTITVRERFDSHKLIEEFMIAANVAAAAQLEQRAGHCLYRVHDKPTEMKLEGLRDFLKSLDISLVAHKDLHPRALTHILTTHAGGPHAEVVNEMILRSQAQAIYSPDNIGHFGLALAKYAHFTSPIRRYADLIVHRGLITMGNLGDDGLTEREKERLEDIAAHISSTERRSAMAERDATDRFITLYMADHVGTTFPARISGVARFGLFARLNDTGADGIIPIGSLPHDYYFHDEARQALVGKRTKRTYQLAQPVKVRLEQADRLTGGMSFVIIEDEPSKAGRSSQKGKPSRHKVKIPVHQKPVGKKAQPKSTEDLSFPSKSPSSPQKTPTKRVRKETGGKKMKPSLGKKR